MRYLPSAAVNPMRMNPGQTRRRRSLILDPISIAESFGIVLPIGGANCVSTSVVFVVRFV